MDQLIRLLCKIKARLSTGAHLKNIEDILNIQANNLSSPYMYGLYNGLLMGYCILTDTEYNPLPVPDPDKIQKPICGAILEPKRIRILTDLIRNKAGDVVELEELLQDENLYYRDRSGYYCYFTKEEEGKLWEWEK